MSARLFSVLVTKRPGVEVVFGRYPRAQAELLVVQLGNINCAARVAPAREGDVAGLSRPPRAARTSALRRLRSETTSATDGQMRPCASLYRWCARRTCRRS